MTKEEFINNTEPLVLIVGLNIDTGKVMYDTYPIESETDWLDQFKKDFPDHLFFIYKNETAKKWIKENLFGMKTGG